METDGEENEGATKAVHVIGEDKDSADARINVENFILTLLGWFLSLCGMMKKTFY